MDIEHIIFNKTTGKQVLEEIFGTKQEAEQQIVDIIRGANTRKQALKYYQDLRTKESKN